MLWYPFSHSNNGGHQMPHARAPHLKLVVNEHACPAARRPRLRFRPIVCLQDGTPFGIHVETDCEFEESRFGRPAHAEATAGGWLAGLIERAVGLALETGIELRPISVTAPLAALQDRDAPLAAEAAASRCRVLPSEIRIDFADSAVAALEDFALDRLDAFRKRGFRVGLDARRCWDTPMSARARATFEAVRIDLSSRRAAEVPPSRLEVAAADGVALIAENARWRDADLLAELGVAFALAPRADS